MGDGFLGYPTSLMLDVVVVSLVVVVPALLFSLYQVKVRRNYLLHRNIQVVLGVVLLVAVGAFEIDMRMQGGVDGILAKRSVPLSAEQYNFFRYQLLRVHLLFSVTTCVLWVVTLVSALRTFPSPPVPGGHSVWHKRLGWLSAVDITLTAVTGLMVYYYGFMV